MGGIWGEVGGFGVIGALGAGTLQLPGHVPRRRGHAAAERTRAEPIGAGSSRATPETSEGSRAQPGSSWRAPETPSNLQSVPRPPPPPSILPGPLPSISPVPPIPPVQPSAPIPPCTSSAPLFPRCPPHNAQFLPDPPTRLPLPPSLPPAAPPRRPSRPPQCSRPLLPAPPLAGQRPWGGAGQCGALWGERDCGLSPGGVPLMSGGPWKGKWLW